jgi:methyl-accepting chemotaxis protein
MRFRSIATRLQVLMSAALIAAVLIVAICSAWYSLRTQQVVSEQAEKNLKQLSAQVVTQRGTVAAEDMVAGYRRAYAIASTFSDALAQLQQQAKQQPASAALLRKTGGDMTHAALQRHGDLLGAWYGFELNAFDGNDRGFVGRSDVVSNEVGRPAPFWARDDSGALSLEVMNEDYFTNAQADESTGIPNNYWYTCARDKKSSCFIEPYLDNVNGKDVLMSSVAVAVMSNNQAVGVTGCDFRVDQLSQLAATANASLWQGSGRMWLMASGGLIVADSKLDDSFAAKKLNEVNIDNREWFARRLSEQSAVVDFDEDGDHIVAWIPVDLGDGKTFWGIALELPKTAVLAEVDAMRETMQSQTRNALITQILVGLVVIVVAAVLVTRLSQSISQPIKYVGQKLREIALGGGDLTQRLPVNGEDEVAQLSQACNELLTTLQQLIQMVGLSSNAVNESAERTAHLAQDNAKGIAAQQTEIDLVATASTEMSSAIAEVAHNANNAASAAENARKQAQDGHHVVDATVHAIRSVSSDVGDAADVIKKLAEDSARVGSILDAVRGIAEQTNLLALNAAIEAARAGDQGRGFAVVADEVRQLAQRTHSSTQEIQEIIAAIRLGTNKAVEAMEKSRSNTETSVHQANSAGQALTAITQSIATISDMNLQIAAAVEEQSKVTEEITRNVTAIRDVAQTLAMAANESADTGTQLNQAADRLHQLLRQFKV